MKRGLSVAVFLVVALLMSSLAHPAEPPAAQERAEPPPAVETAPTNISPPLPTMTPEPIEEPSPTPVSRYAGIEITDDDIETLARLVWLEARGEPLEGQAAVVEVVLNRILSPSFPDTVEEVVFQKLGEYWQFSPAARIPTTTPTEAQYEAVAAAIEGIDPITDADVVYFSVGAYNERVYATIGNHIFCRE